MVFSSALFTTFLIAALIICVTPGPDMLYVLSFGIAKGRAGGLAAAGGVALGMIFHTVLAAFGVSAVIAQYPEALGILKALGAGYLCYMGFVLIWDMSPISFSEDKQGWSIWRIARKAMTANVANPKILVFYITFLPQFVSPRGGPVYLQVLLLGSLFVVMGFATDATVGVLSGSLGNRLISSPKGVRRLNVGCGIVMFLLAVVVFLAG